MHRCRHFIMGGPPRVVPFALHPRPCVGDKLGARPWWGTAGQCRGPERVWGVGVHPDIPLRPSLGSCTPKRVRARLWGFPPVQGCHRHAPGFSGPTRLRLRRERQESMAGAPEKIYTCLINVKCSLQTGVTSTSLYNIHRHTIIDTPE